MENITYNLIFQNLNFLLGNIFLESKIDSKTDIVKELENDLNNIYGKELTKKIIDMYFILF